MAAALLVLGGACNGAFAQSATCPAHSSSYLVEDSGATTVIHCRCDPGYHIGAGACVPTPLPVAPRLSCTVAKARVAADLEQFAKQRELAVENQVQFNEWKDLGKDGRNNLMIAGLKLAVGTYAAQEIVAGKDLDALEEDTKTLENSVTSMQKLKQAKAELAAEGIPLNALVPRLAAKRALEASDSWELSKGAMNDAFRAAAGTNAQLATELNDPQFRNALLGPPEETTTYDHAANALNATVGVLTGMKNIFGHYTDITGPTVLVTSFVIDAAYADLQLWFASRGTAQANHTAGQLARAAGLMQAKYTRDLTDAQSCAP
ncbi:hypothetical protein GCM10010909_15610 [Acidocella aquatica]|uniref:Uncharacterized protein n=1 Tax=Acidocella aquatica TaxID=1922313 RepID=A0ABQ6A4W0_9PROT|nr:hypothetical protein GCM10010909_15610 [Acidocella aquatica]